MSPLDTAAATAAQISAASRALVMRGNGNITGRSLRGGSIPPLDAQPESHRVAIQRHLDGLLGQRFRNPENLPTDLKVSVTASIGTQARHRMRRFSFDQ